MGAVAKLEVHVQRHVFQVKNRSATDREGDFLAISDVQLRVEAGEFLVIVGPSGCGKTTLLDILAGLTEPTSGSVRIDGQAVTGPSLSRGIVFQQYALLPWRTALSNVAFSLEARGGLSRQKRERIAQDFLNLVGLSGFESHYPHELSGGMKQRVAIARSLAYEPDILLMDEPFGALDAQTRETLQDELLSLWRRTGKTIVFITHSIDEAVYLGQRVAVMKARPGRVVEIVDIDLPDVPVQEDIRSLPAFSAYRHHLWSLLSDRRPAASGRADTADAL